MTSRYNHSREEGEPSPADEFFPPEPDQDYGTPEPELEPWQNKFIKVTGQVVAVAVLGSVTFVIILLCAGAVWWTLRKMF